MSIHYIVSAVVIVLAVCLVAQYVKLRSATFEAAQYKAMLQEQVNAMEASLESSLRTSRIALSILDTLRVEFWGEPALRSRNFGDILNAIRFLKEDRAKWEATSRKMASALHLSNSELNTAHASLEATSAQGRMLQDWLNFIIHHQLSVMPPNSKRQLPELEEKALTKPEQFAIFQEWNKFLCTGATFQEAMDRAIQKLSTPTSDYK